MEFFKLKLKKYLKSAIKPLACASVLSFGSLLVSLLNVSLNENTLNFLTTFQGLTGYLTQPVINAFLWYEAIFFIMFLLAYALAAKAEKNGLKVSAPLIVLVFLLVIMARSIVVEPYLYQTFYSAMPPFAFLMDALLYFDIKWLLDLIILSAIVISAIILLQRFAWIALAVFLLTIIPVKSPEVNEANNGETVILLITDSLRKDAIKKEDLFVRQIFHESMVIENMYSVFPASIPALAAIFSGEYPYQSKATALSLDKQLDLSFIEELGSQYRLSAHVDYSDDDVINRSNFNIPFDEVHAPKIDLESTIYANTLTKQVVLMALISDTRLRNILLPQLYTSDSNANTAANLNASLDYLSVHRKDKKIALVSMGETHIPYKATYPYYRPFLGQNQSRDFRWVFDYADFSYTGSSHETNQNIRNLYTMSVERFDDYLEYFIKGLEQRKLLKNTTLVIVADQGENLFDNNLDLYSHNNLDTKHVLNVPFAVYRNDRSGSVVKDKNYALMDTLKIALNPDRVADYSRPQIYLEADLDVHDKTNPLYAGNIGSVLDVKDINNVKIIDNETLQKYKRRGLIEGDYILTYHPHKNFNHSLYHIPSDPLFQNDLKATQLEIYTNMLEKLNQFIELTKKY